MAKSQQDGFTLIELMIVFAISGMLLMIAFAGQSALRQRTRFDAAVDKMSATVAQVRNEATAGVNFGGIGDGTGSPGSCNANAATKIQNIYAGTVWTADNSASTYATFKVDYYVAQIDKSNDPQGVYRSPAKACQFDTRTITYASPVTVNVTSATASQRGARILYVRTITGGVVVCKSTDLSVPVEPSFASGTCAGAGIVPVTVTSPAWTLSIGDGTNLTSKLLIDPSGLTKRLN